MSWSWSRRLSVWSSKTRTAAPGSASGIAVRSSERSAERTSVVLRVRSVTARPTGSAQAGGSRASQGRPGSAVTGVCTSSANTRLARRTTPAASMMQIAWVMASTVCSHSRLALESSSTRRAFSSAIATCATTARTVMRSSGRNAPGRSETRDTAPTGRDAATRGAPIQEPGAGTVCSSLTPWARAAATTSRANSSGPRRNASCSRGSSVRTASAVEWKAPASSWDRAVRRASRAGPRCGGDPPLGGSFMILANVRSRLRAADLRLVILALSRGDAGRRDRYERALAVAGPDPRLDDESYDYLGDILADLAEQDEGGERGFLLQTHL